jgi:hypothetical protein
MATIEQFRESLHGAPFVPFTVRLVDGRSLVVRHPDFAATDPKGRQLTIFDDDAMHRIDLRLVVEITVPIQAETDSGGK